jgi:hypothetical protein
MSASIASFRIYPTYIYENNQASDINFLHPSITFSLLDIKYSLQLPVSQRCFLRAIYQFMHPNKTMTEIIVLYVLGFTFFR